MDKPLSVAEAAARIRRFADLNHTPRIMAWHQLHKLADELEGKSGSAVPENIDKRDPNEKL